MKKWLLILLILIISGSLAIYFVMPSTLTVAVIQDIHCTINGSNRILLDENNWGKWWPADKPAREGKDTSGYIYEGFNYQVKQKLYNQFIIAASNKKEAFNSELILLPVSNDSVRVFWNYQLTSGRNPLNKIRYYLQARRLKQNAMNILAELRRFLEKTENVYGIDIVQKPTEKTFLVAGGGVLNHNPTVEDIYGIVSKLSSYVAEEQAVQTGPPMVNIRRLDSMSYEMMVAIPVNKQLQGKPGITMRKIVTVKALYSTVSGGNHTIQHAIKELNNYAIDHRLFSPAIPYAVLITDRREQPDTAKWITGVYLPIL